MKHQYVFLGAPGSGKGTQAQKLVGQGLKHVSTGDLLRSEIAKGSDLGKSVQGILSAGHLVDDETVLKLLRANIDLANQSNILDGFPRNVKQAEMLETGLLSGVSYKVVFFSIDDGLLLERLTNRRTCKSCGAIYNLATKPPKVDGICDVCGLGPLVHRDDDKAGVVAERLRVYGDATKPLLEYYRAKDKLEVLDASKDESEIFTALSRLLRDGRA